MMYIKIWENLWSQHGLRNAWTLKKNENLQCGEERQYSARWRDISVSVKCDTIFRLLFSKITTIFSAVTYWRYGGKYYTDFVGMV